MPKIETKSQLLEKVNSERALLERELASLSAEERITPGVVGEWSAKDLLAHLARWEQMFLGWHDATLRGEIPAVPAPGITWKPADVDRLNRQIFEDHCHLSFEEVLALFRDAHASFLQRVESFREEDLFTPRLFPWIGGAKMATWITHYALHDGWARKAIHRWVRER